ncbi:MAG: UvrD-helicase domain-containing protein [Clostridia bacterium]|nr:UvrD-helicase domain-containing protein [Clostridia bacterium]
MDFLKIRQEIIENRYKGLNAKQKEAVFTTEGPLLVLAGAGSGKTTVIINRIAHLIEYGRAYFDTTTPRISEEEIEVLSWYAKGEVDEIPESMEEFLKVSPVSPYNILAITFTNKAAAELKTRLAKRLGEEANDIMASTFHSACVKILRRDADKIGYDRSFNIFDTADAQTVIKECMKELNIDSKNFSPKAFGAVISRAKDSLLTPEDFIKEVGKDFFGEVACKVYAFYQSKLKSYNAFDFDDLIGCTVKLFEENPKVLEYYQNRFKYILVDEYQDTNHAQYRLVSLLAGESKNLCVVGDDDQSIYKFRGADISNILGFEKEFTNAKIIKLEENYRSTGNVLSAANEVIKNNKGRRGKELWTKNEQGEKITLYRAEDERDEAKFITEEINKLTQNGGSFNDIVVLYRMNAQSRVIEDALLHNAIPYRVLGGLRFYDRKEIKDLTSYLRLIQNCGDNIALKRIINEPKRGIGDTTIEKIENIARDENKSMYEICLTCGEYDDLSKVKNKLSGFTDIIESLKNTLHEEESLENFVEAVINKSGMISALELEKSVENQTRIENIKEFLSMVVEAVKNNPETTLETLLEDISLISDIDNYDESAETVTLMTLHSAKGLEFPNVFLVGLEEGIFPGMRSMESEEELEEERRLCYVGITRAKKRLFITHARCRTLFGSTRYETESRFIGEISDDLLDKQYPKKAKATFGGFDTRGTTPKVSFDKGSSNLGQTRETTKKANFESFSEGDKVVHTAFGGGIVKSAKPMGADLFLIIDFEGVGEKKLLASYTGDKLKKV